MKNDMKNDRKNDMKELIAKTTNPAAVGRLLRDAADRFDQMRQEMFPKHAAKDTKNEEGTAHER